MSHEAAAVRLSRRLYDEIVAHARAGKPEEVCGIVRGRGLEALEIIRARNIADERIENYTVDPQTLLRQFEFEDAGDEMLAIYHSHPVSVAYPSATDAWNANYPDSVYLICSLEFDDAPVLRGFRMSTHWLDLEIAGLRAVLPFYETRPHLFAYYQPADSPPPAVLAALDEQAPAPFYVDFFTDEEGEIVDSRVVSVKEVAVIVG